MADDFFSLSMLMKKFHKTHERCVWHNDTYLIGHLTSFWQVLMMVDLVSVGQVERPCCDCFRANFLCKIVTTGVTANFIIIVMNNTFWAVREIKSQACKPWSYASSKSIDSASYWWNWHEGETHMLTLWVTGQSKLLAEGLKWTHHC